MKVTSYRPYASRPAASVEKSGFSALLFPEEHAAAELRSAVQDGSYHIPARDLADAILEWRIL